MGMVGTRIVGALIAASVFLVAGCATTTNVVPIGNGNYELAGSSATALASGGTEKVRLIERANAFCGQQGRQALLENSDDTNGHVGGFASGAWGGGGFSAVKGGQRATADVVFRCQ
jgi:hypothetical protein